MDMKGEKRMIKKKSVSIMKKTNLYDESERRLEELSKIKQKKEDVIKNVPSGKIRVAVSGNRTQFYVRNESSEKCGVYISKTETADYSARSAHAPKCVRRMVISV